VPNVIFDMPPFSYALVTFDLRHLLEESYNWTYGEDWAISFTLKENLTIHDLSEPVLMPEQFLETSMVKAGILEF